MRKIIIGLFILTLIFINNSNSEEILIPSSAIRIRIIGNSDEYKDQEVKSKVRKEMQIELTKLLKASTSIEETRKILNENMNNFHNVVEKVLKNNNYNEDFHINYGLNYFPKKEFKGINYDEGYYESMVISIGKAKGTNWWCVLFPPLCLMEEEENNIDKVEYKSFIKEIINKFM